MRFRIGPELGLGAHSPGHFFSNTVIIIPVPTFWYRGIWRLTARIQNSNLRGVLRGVWVAAMISVIVSAIDSMQVSYGHIIPRGSMVTAAAGLWFASALFAYMAVKIVRSFEWLWVQGKKLRNAQRRANSASTSALQDRELLSPPSKRRFHQELLENPSRRYFFQTATTVAGALPFLGALYGFAAERLHYVVHEVPVPIANLPSALEGLRIAQISDIHMSGYMTREQVRRAVDMVNELAPDLAVVTGDFITGAGDSLEDCVAEIARIRAALGTLGCNGNHEIYAGFEDLAQQLFARSGMRLLREENVQLVWRGTAFNVIGVDYQRQRTAQGRPFPMLQNVQSLVRNDVPNILLSHNPNAFPRAAQMGIELTLAGHTHGGQVQVEILDHSFTPARFITDFTAGLYHRPFDKTSVSANMTAPHISYAGPAKAALYVNRGLGTVGAPIRIGVPPEITLLTLKRA